MAELHTYDGTHLTLVRDGSVQLVQSAETGQVGSGSLAIDDTAGTLAITGQKNYVHTESACANTVTHRGFIGPREYGRDAGQERAPHVGAARGIAVELTDGNAVLGFRGITGDDRRRPTETVAERGAWLLASDYVSGLFVNNGRCTFPDTEMNKADYTDQYPGDVLADMAQAALGANYHVNDWGSGFELTFRNDNTSTADTSSIKISNVLADVDSGPETLGAGKIFAPSKDFALRRDPGRVFSKIVYQYAKGRVVQERTATATAFNGQRFGVFSNANVRTSPKAQNIADDVLWQHHTEEDVLTGTILVPNTAVNLIRAGERLQCKFSHLNTEGYGSYSYFRVLERRVHPINAEAAIYEVGLKLSPQEAADIPGDCVDIYPGTPSGTYYPLGGTTSTSTANPSDGVVVYARPGDIYPTNPTNALGQVNHWHFPIFGAGGLGTIDYAGDCTQNQLRFIVVGNGTMTVQTEVYGGSPRPMQYAVFKSDGTVVAGAVTLTSGESVEIVIDDTTDGDCVRLVDFGDGPNSPCGGKWGFSQMDWAAA